MWSCLLLTDAASQPAGFGGLTLVPADDPIALVDAIGAVASGHVLVAAPRSLSVALATGLTITAGRWPLLRTTSLVSEHAPLAVLAAMSQARQVTDDPMLGVALVRRLLESAWSGAWTESVAALARPVPSFSQHLRSLLPGSGFLLRQEPGPAVLAGPRDDDVPTVGLGRVLLVEQGRVPGPVAERLSKAVGVSAVQQVTVPGRWTSVYGTDRTGQVALLPADPAQLLGLVTHRCPACGSGLADPVCPFCRVLGHPAVPAAHTGGRS